jgi:broad specificity phosphatase PhoE
MTFPNVSRDKPWLDTMEHVGDIILIRHGQTAWSASGQHTSSTDLELTTEGERQARALSPMLEPRAFIAVLTSAMRRAQRTAELAGLAVTSVDPDLSEWDYGKYEGRTTAEILSDRPDWSLWTDGCPDGESPEQVGTRMDRVLGRIRSLLEEGDVAIVGHGHASRVLTARWLDRPVRDGALYRLDSGTISTLGFEHGHPVIVDWNHR